MYQYSLDWYINLFESSIDLAEKSKILEDRLRNLNDCFTYLLYKNVCRSLFEKDKLLFSFLLTTKILINNTINGATTAVTSSNIGNKATGPNPSTPMQSTSLDVHELRFLLQGNLSMDKNVTANPHSSWLTDKSWGDLCALCEFPRFKSFLSYFQSKHQQFKQLMTSSNVLTAFNDIFKDDGEVLSSPAIHIASSPRVGNTSEIKDSMSAFTIDSFKKLCILRCLRPDIMIPAIQEFITKEMGSKFIEPPSIQIKECYQVGHSVCRSYGTIIRLCYTGLID